MMYLYRRNLPVLIFFILLFTFLLAGCSGVSTPTSAPTTPDLTGMEETLSASAEIVPERWVNLGFASGAQAVEILMKPGDTVNAGQVLVTSSTTQLGIAETQAQTALRRAELALEQLKEPPSQAQIAAAEAALATAEANLDQLERIFAEEIEIEAGKAGIESAQAALDALKAGPSELQLDAAQVEVDAARAGLDGASAALLDAELKAPFAGTIIEVYVQTGENALPGQTVILLADLSSLLVETTDFSEIDVPYIQVGDSASVTFDAMPDKILDGTVERIANKASPGSGVYFKVIIRLKETPENLRWGMSAFVEFKPER